MVMFEMREGILSGNITLTMIWKGDAPMLCAISITLGLTSLRLLSTSLTTKGKAAMVRGTMDAAVPTAVPIMARVSGETKIISIRKGTERSRFIMTLSTCITGFGSGSTPPFSPATSSTPKGRPIIMARAVDSTVT